MLPTRGSTTLLALIAVLLVVIAGLLAIPYLRPAPTMKFQTTYQAVLLSGGQVYFGKLEGLGTPYPTLRDVFYVQSQVNPDTKAVNNILVRRGKEWHGPEYMVLNPNHIILVEPVSPDSQVAKLIAEQKK